MYIPQFKIALTSALLWGLLATPAVYAAKPLDLNHQPINALLPFSGGKGVNGVPDLQELNRSIDFNKTAHVRIQQNFNGYPIWGADAVIHIPNGANAGSSLASLLSVKNGSITMNGILYQELQADLSATSSAVLTEAAKAAALKKVINDYQRQTGQREVKDAKNQMIVFIDKNNKAHWAYKISFSAAPLKSGAVPSKPVYIIDANTGTVFEQWDDIKTAKDNSGEFDGGGFGGNVKMGKLVYDGLDGHLAKLTITRKAKSNLCFLKNADVTVKDHNSGKVISFDCETGDAEHNNVYWDADLDQVNDGYSPGNDALFGGAVIKNMYKQWYGVPVLTENGKPMMLNMVVHEYMDNAYWDGRQMTFGDGIDMFYPLTSLGVAAHEISHGFTEQHSNLAYYGQSGGMNEAFSDMAAQAAEVYAYGKNSWQIGPEIFKQEDRALRYMDQPSKDCYGKKPGSWCSIDEVSQYYNGLNVHFSSGIYNRVYYLIGTAEGWTPRKAFDLMVKANTDYWTSSTTFAQGACGVLSAAKDYGYDDAAVKKAFDVVGVNYSKC